MIGGRVARLTPDRAQVGHNGLEYVEFAIGSSRWSEVDQTTKVYLHPTVKTFIHSFMREIFGLVSDTEGNSRKVEGRNTPLDQARRRPHRIRKHT